MTSPTLVAVRAVVAVVTLVDLLIGMHRLFKSLVRH